MESVKNEYENKSLMLSKKISKGDKYIPAETLRQIYELIDNPRDRAYIMFHAETGVRVSDIVGQKKKKNNERELGLEVQNIDWQNLRAYVYDHKKNSWRYVYFPEKVKSALKMWMQERQIKDINDRQLFPFSEKTANRILKYWCKKAGFQYASIVGSHWLRHTFIRLSRKAGRDIKAVQQNTGDKVKTILEWYSDLSAEDMRAEIDNRPIT